MKALAGAPAGFDGLSRMAANKKGGLPTWEPAFFKLMLNRAKISARRAWTP